MLLWILVSSFFLFCFCLSQIVVTWDEEMWHPLTIFHICRYFYMVAIPKKFHLIKMALRRELFIQTCGLLILGLGNGTRSVCFLSCCPHLLLLCARGIQGCAKIMIFFKSKCMVFVIITSFICCMLLCYGYSFFFF